MSVYTARLTDDWLPLPEGALKESGWKEGDTISVEVVGEAIVLTKLEDDTRMTVREAPKKTRRL